MKRLLFLPCVLLLFMVAGCSSGKKALQEGNYSQAVFQAVDRLRSSPENKNSLKTLKEAYPLAIEMFSIGIGEILRSNAPDKYAQIAAKYETMNRMADEIRHCPAALEIIRRPESYGEQLLAAREKAGPEAYNLGMDLLKMGTREKAREAYFQFLNADRFVPGYQDVKNKIEQARFDATLKVVVEQISVPGRYKISSDFFFDQVYSFLQNGLRHEFVRYYSPGEARDLPYVDEILVMQFEDFIVGAINDKESEKEYTSKDSVKVGTATINGQKVDVYNQVKAKLITHRREVISTGILSVQVLENRTRKTKANQKFPGTFVWVSEWANFNGDERALTPQQLEFCKKKPAMPPPPQDLFLEFTKPIFEQAKSFLRNYYRNN